MQELSIHLFFFDKKIKGWYSPSLKNIARKIYLVQTSKLAPEPDIPVIATPETYKYRLSSVVKFAAFVYVTRMPAVYDKTIASLPPSFALTQLKLIVPVLFAAPYFLTSKRAPALSYVPDVPENVPAVFLSCSL
jgi:hypothetical protein